MHGDLANGRLWVSGQRHIQRHIALRWVFDGQLAVSCKARRIVDRGHKDMHRRGGRHAIGVFGRKAQVATIAVGICCGLVVQLVHLIGRQHIANGQHTVAHLGELRAVHDHHGQFVELDFQHRQIGFWIGADQLGLGASTIVEHDIDFISRLNHMVVGENETVRADDDATAQAHLRGRLVLVAKEITKPRVFGPVRQICVAGGVDADHGGRRFFGRTAQAAHTGGAGN